MKCGVKDKDLSKFNDAKKSLESETEKEIEKYWILKQNEFEHLKRELTKNLQEEEMAFENEE